MFWVWDLINPSVRHFFAGKNGAGFANLRNSGRKYSRLWAQQDAIFRKDQ
jgi:hypothetical protein